eukprot:TRINITY_DN3931_c2_g1_i2.p1 TRINITY_DN3931_c2_g1~~TRINITY_DN3931_c2_g1_i2.p1  ORF type:complete len:270 (+),score=51.58 TRINITY_DN3931_c2_g1_i2:79-888(+)
MFGWGKESYDKNKMKAALKMAVTRMKMQQGKKTNSIKVQRSEIANLMRDEKNESARIKVEQVMRDEYYIEAMELVVLFCDLVSSRLLLLNESRSCPPDLKESLSTIVWACPRTDGVSELIAIRKQIMLKYGQQWIEMANDNAERAVNQRVADKLSVMVPDPYLCMQYLEGIAKEFELDWESASEAIGKSDLVPASQGVWDNGKALHPEHHAGPPACPTCVPQHQNHHHHHHQPTAPPPGPGPAYPPPGGAPPDDDFADLESRFQALKRQ